jgi:hypothetical protein
MPKLWTCKVHRDNNGEGCWSCRVAVDYTLTRQWCSQCGDAAIGYVAVAGDDVYFFCEAHFEEGRNRLTPTTGPELAAALHDALAERDALKDEHEMFRPHGPCATGCGHQATVMWQLYKGIQRYEFRCRCCEARGKLERAQWHAAQIATLEQAYETAKGDCQ